MKLHALLIALFFVSINVYAHSKQIIFVDANSNIPIESVNVTLNIDGFEKPVKLKSDDTGKISFHGNVTKLSARRLGYADLTVKDVTGIKDTLFLKSDLILSEIDVIGVRRNFNIKPDRYVYDVSSDSTLSGKSAFDALGRIPILNVTQDGNISSMQGKTLIYKLNGLTSPLLSGNLQTALLSLGAGDVSRIELKPDPQGNNPNVMEVNIITKGRIEGYQAVATLAVKDYSIRPVLWGLTKYKNFCISGSYAYNYLRYHNVKSVTDEWFNRDANNAHRSITIGEENGFKAHLNGVEISMSYDISDSAIISAFASIMTRSKATTGLSSQTSILNRDMDLLTEYNKFQTTYLGGNEYSANLNYEKFYGRDGEEGKLFIGYDFYYRPATERYDVDYQIESCLDPNYLPNFEKYVRHNKYTWNMHTTMAEYRRVINKRHTIFASATYRYRSTEDKQKMEQEPWSTVLLQQHHADASFAYKFATDKLSLKGNIGIVYYHDDTKTNTMPIMNYFKRNSFIWRPTIAFNYVANGRRSYEIAYALNSHVPGIDAMNPYVFQDEVLRKTYGNPNLSPEKSHNISAALNFSFDRSFLGLNFTGQYANNLILQYSFMDADDVLNTTYGNIGTRKSISFTPFFSWWPSRNTSLRLNANIDYIHYNSRILNMSNSGVQFGSRVTISQNLPWNLYGELSASYNSPWINFQGRGRRSYEYGFSLVRNFLSKRLRVSVSAYNFAPIYYKRSSYVETADYRMDNSIRQFHANFGITIRYSFGHLKARVKQSESSISNSDIKKSYDE